MKIIATSDWHLGNVFHGNDRLDEHRHFMRWLLERLREERPDALLIAGDIFDNGNPSAASQSAYYSFLADAVRECPAMRVVITAGNHDSASRLEAPREILRHNRVEVRGTVKRRWRVDPESGEGELDVDFDELVVPIRCADGREVDILAVPFLRPDVVGARDYSKGVCRFLASLTECSRLKHPESLRVMMAHMYAKGSEIAGRDASEKIIIGGQEEVNMDSLEARPDYLTCGHIHKRQHIFNTDWARYTGSVLPMSFAEKDYIHGVDLITLSDSGRFKVRLLEYEPQHKLSVIPEDDEPHTMAQIKKIIAKELDQRPADGTLSENFKYVALKVCAEKISPDNVRELESYLQDFDAVLCKTTRILQQKEITAGAPRSPALRMCCKGILSNLSGRPSYIGTTASSTTARKRC